MNPLTILLHQSLDRMTKLDTVIFVLFTSFVGLCLTFLTLLGFLTGTKISYQCFHHLEPRSKLPLIFLFFVVPALLSIPISYHILWFAAAVLLAFVTYGCAVISFTLMYRLSPFHPLAKYPGPTLAKTSKLWGAYLCAKGDTHRRFKSLHDRYGDVIRVGSCLAIPLMYVWSIS